MNRNCVCTIVLGIVAAIGMTGCRRETAPAPEATPAAAARTPVAPADAPNPVPDIDAAAVVEDPAAAGVDLAAFDVKGFAGRFSAPDVALDLHADGTFALEQAAAGVLAGTWTREADGAHILLDPDSKSEQDRRYAMLGEDELQPAGDAGPKLRREGR